MFATCRAAAAPYAATRGAMRCNNGRSVCMYATGPTPKDCETLRRHGTHAVHFPDPSSLNWFSIPSPAGPSKGDRRNYSSDAAVTAGRGEGSCKSRTHSASLLIRADDQHPPPRTPLRAVPPPEMTTTSLLLYGVGRIRACKSLGVRMGEKRGNIASR